MKTINKTALIREMRLLMEVAIMQDATDFSDTGLWFTYVEWEASRKWLIDVNRGKAYCFN